MPDNLRWSWCNNYRNKVHLNHPQTIPLPICEKLSFTKLVPGAEKVGDCWVKWHAWGLIQMHQFPISVLYLWIILNCLQSWELGSHNKRKKVKVAQLCLFLRPHGLNSPWNSPGQNTGVGGRSLLQGIFPTQGWNPGLPHCRWIL